ncbi:MAG: glucose-1-phosphate thymidylyltransferase [Saprospiraceae bacterium]|nr:glucose-1-phosphate thymidylyltransferase [Saprospiraceae bacterium]
MSRNIILFDDDSWEHLLPISFTKPVGELRIGVLTLREKWENLLGGTATYITQDHLAQAYPLKIEEDNYLINAAYLPSRELVKLIEQLNINEAIMDGEDLIGARFPRSQFDLLIREEPIRELNGFQIKDTPFFKINRPWHFFQYNEIAMQWDVEWLSKQHSFQIPDQSNHVIQGDRIYIEKGALVRNAFLNAEQGPIYIRKGAQVMEGTMIRGPFALGEQGVLKMGTKVYGPTTLGPGCTGGGEIKQSIMMAYSNKGHDGYLGNSVIGSFCNLGAGTSTSNLKNTLDEVAVWSYAENQFVQSGSPYCGTFMGDYVRTGIHTMLTTGTVIGPYCNLFGDGYFRKYIPAFTWGGPQGFQTFSLAKAQQIVEATHLSKNQPAKDLDWQIAEAIYHKTEAHRASYTS